MRHMFSCEQKVIGMSSLSAGTYHLVRFCCSGTQGSSKRRLYRYERKQKLLHGSRRKEELAPAGGRFSRQESTLKTQCACLHAGQIVVTASSGQFEASHRNLVNRHAVPWRCVPSTVSSQFFGFIAESLQIACDFRDGCSQATMTAAIVLP